MMSGGSRKVTVRSGPTTTVISRVLIAQPLPQGLGKEYQFRGISAILSVQAALASPSVALHEVSHVSTALFYAAVGLSALRTGVPCRRAVSLSRGEARQRRAEIPQRLACAHGRRDAGGDRRTDRRACHQAGVGAADLHP